MGKKGPREPGSVTRGGGRGGLPVGGATKRKKKKFRKEEKSGCVRRERWCGVDPRVRARAGIMCPQQIVERQVNVQPGFEPVGDRAGFFESGGRRGIGRRDVKVCTYRDEMRLCGRLCCARPF